MSRLLLADDDKSLCDMLIEYLEKEGFNVDRAEDGEMALAMAQADSYDLMILDIMMPKMNGFDVLRRLRPHSLMPVIILTAKGDDVDSVLGLELGADDYLPKPCNPRVLVARIRAILRRVGSQAERMGKAEVIKIDNVECQTGARKILVDGTPLVLTSTEYNVLEALLRQAGQVVTKESLSETALGRKLTRYDRSLDMHISNLRKKIGLDSKGNERIQTIRGTGYMYSLLLDQ